MGGPIICCGFVFRCGFCSSLWICISLCILFFAVDFTGWDECKLGGLGGAFLLEDILSWYLGYAVITMGSI